MRGGCGGVRSTSYIYICYKYVLSSPLAVSLGIVLVSCVIAVMASGAVVRMLNMRVRVFACRPCDALSCAPALYSSRWALCVLYCASRHQTMRTLA